MPFSLFFFFFIVIICINGICSINTLKQLILCNVSCTSLGLLLKCSFCDYSQSSGVTLPFSNRNCSLRSEWDY